MPAQGEQHFDEGTVALGLFQQAIVDGGDRRGQLPMAKGNPVAQGPRFLLEQEEVVPRIEYPTVTRKAARRACNLPGIGDDDDRIGISGRHSSLT